MRITPENSHTEHIPGDAPAHDEAECPGPDVCAVAAGLHELLRKLDSGEMVFRRVQ
jgi:hypothetical protein